MREIVAGVDEAGRGPLAGPVVTAAVVLNPNAPIEGLADSKTLSAARRHVLEIEIKSKALYWAIGSAEVAEIDSLNILQATLLAMQRALNGLPIMPTQALVDGNTLPMLPYPAKAVIRGDAIHAEISAASILAKQERDRRMLVLSISYPEYGFERNKGYPTRAHLDAMNRHGISVHHRRSYAPVRRLIRASEMTRQSV